jgi:NTE family protein
VRLPKGFTLPLITIALAYFLFAFPYLNEKVGRYYENLNSYADRYEPYFSNEALAAAHFFLRRVLLRVFSSISAAFLTLCLALIGTLLSYWVSGTIYHYYRRLRAKPKPSYEPVSPRFATLEEETQEAKKKNPLERYERIGIILSGGGAKGAYQAGALQAIYEFLEEHGAHHKVKMIAGTSIGSWNALFWLANLMKSKNGGPGPLEQWWSEINVQNIILPTPYVPTRQNYFLSNDPWQNNFNAIFRGTEAGERLLYHVNKPDEPDAMHFYFTHSNIGRARLDFTTSHGRRSMASITANLSDGRSEVVPQDSYRSVNDLDDVRKGVFCSMDIPPLFQYSKITNKHNGNIEYFEDGGVIDNLPIRFGTEFENCDLLFVLPLNASFEKEVNHQSVIRRLARVTEIRQGVLERNSFKMLYLYNELATLRKRVEDLGGELPPIRPPRGDEGVDRKIRAENRIANTALKRTHDPVHVFSICPAPKLKISTTEFWKSKDAADAFKFMYEVTKHELKRFHTIVNLKDICMALVRPDGKSGKAATGDDGAATEQVVEEEISGKTTHRVTDSKMAYSVTYSRDF